MKNVSEEFKKLSKKIKLQDLKLSIIEEEKIVKEIHVMPVNIFNSMPVNLLRARKEVIAKELRYSFEGELFKTIMQQIEITVKNASEIKGKNINFQYGIQVNNQFEYVDIGEYYIKDVEDDKNKEELTVTGYDKMLNFMKAFKQSELLLEYPCEIGQLVSRMGEVCGVELYSTDFYNSDLIIDEDFFTAQELTYRDVLEKVAQTTLTTIFIKENKLYLCKIGESVQTLDISFLSELVVGEKFGPVNALVLGRGAVEDNIEDFDQQSIDTNGRCEIRFDENEFVDSKRIQVIGGMFQQIKGLEYYSFEASNVGLMWLEPCDVLVLKDREESEYSSIYLKAEVVINTGISGDMGADIPETTTTEYKVTSKEEKKSLKVERIAKKNEGLIKDIIEEVGDRTEKSTSITQDINGITEKIENIEKTAITSVVVEYALSDSITTEPKENWSTTAPEWQEGKYMWQRTVTTYEDKTVVTGKAVCISGATGQQGNKGTGVKKVETEYYLSTSKTEQTGGSWKTTQDTWEEGTYYWIRTKITYDNNEVEYTTPILNEDTNSLREAVTEVKKTADGLNIEVKKKLGIEELGTQLEQNYEHVKIAWNKISEFIQMMILNDNASLAILDQNKNVMMSLDKTGQHFYKSDGKTIFGEMGVQTIDNQNFISFALPTDYDNQLQDGMAWGVTTSSDGKFHPILYIKNFTMPPKNSDGCTGELVLDGCDLVLNSANAGIVATGLKIHGDAMPGVFFTDTETGENILSIMPNNGISDTSLYMLGNICFFKNQAGGRSFRIGDSDGTYCLFSDDGYIIGKDLSLGNLIINGEDGHVSGNMSFGDLPTYLTSYKLVYARSHEISMEWRNNSQLVFWVDTTNVGTLSDKRLKADIKDIDEDFIKAINEVEIKQFKVANRNGLISFGILAQDLIEIFKKYNKNSFDYEIVYETQYRTDDDTIYYAINYEQFLILRQHAKEKELEELKEKDRQKDEIIADLIKRIEKLEGGHSK